MKFTNTFNLNKPLILSFSGGILLFFSLLLYIFDPIAIVTKKLSAFYDGSISFKAWKNPEYDIFIKLYIFNVTNIEDFQNGRDSKLKVEEVGPFVYQEHMSNTNIVFHENGTMSYIPHKHVQFVAEKSIADPKLINVTVPNIPLLGILSYIENSSFFVRMAISSVSNYLDSKPFLTLSAHDFLWGYDDPLIKLANNVVPSWIFFRKFGVLDRLFDEGNNTVSIVTDVKKFKESSRENDLLRREGGIHQFAIHKWNGSPGLSQWGYKNTERNNYTNKENVFCNLLEGAFEGIIFPQEIEQNFTFRLYRKAFCRTLQFVYKDDGVVKDRFYGYRFKLRDDFLDTPETNDDNNCYCIDKKRCLPKGLSFITPCYYGIPIAISLPHFMNADLKSFEDIDGLKPNRSQHESSLVIHPRLGIPLQVNCRIQLNLAVKAKYHGSAPIFDNRIVPLFWVELNVDKPPKMLEFYLTLLYDIIPLINYTVIFLSGILGFTFFILSTFHLTYKISPDMKRSKETNSRKRKLNNSDIPLEIITPLLDGNVR